MWSQNTITNRNHFIIISTRKSIEYLEILDDSRIIFQPWNWSVLLDWTLIRAVGRFENPRGVVMSRAYSAPPPQYMPWSLILIKVLNNFWCFKYQIPTRTCSEAYLQHYWRNCLLNLYFFTFFKDNFFNYVSNMLPSK